MNDYREYRRYTEIYHHGIKGQKWGVRRYQNSSGSHNSSDNRSAGDVAKGVVKEAWKDRKNIVKDTTKGVAGGMVIGAAAGVSLGVVAGIVMSKAARRGMLDTDVNKLGHTIIETGKLATKVALGASSAVGTARSIEKYYNRYKENR